MPVDIVFETISKDQTDTNTRQDPLSLVGIRQEREWIAIL